MKKGTRQSKTKTVKHSQSSGHIVNKLLTIFKEKRGNLKHKIRAVFILQFLELSKLIIHKSLLKTNDNPLSENLQKPPKKKKKSVNKMIIQKIRIKIPFSSKQIYFPRENKFDKTPLDLTYITKLISQKYFQ